MREPRSLRAQRRIRPRPHDHYAIGIEDHYAWANLVSVTLSGRDESLLDRRRVDLLDQSLPASPYHRDTLHLTPPDAERLVHEVQASANRRAAAALSALIADLAPATCLAIAIRQPPLAALPATVAEAHADDRILNRADGMIYHHALTRAAAQLDLSVLQFDKHTVLSLAAHARGTTAPVLERRLKALGRTVGPPWRSGHVLACAGAILAHASTTQVP